MIIGRLNETISCLISYLKDFAVSKKLLMQHSKKAKEPSWKDKQLATVALIIN